MLAKAPGQAIHLSNRQLTVGKQQIHKPLSRRLRFMVGQAGPFVGFDKHILGLVGGGHHQVQAHHGNVQGAGGAHGGVYQRGVQAWSTA